ncbi:recombination-associated protein RdgC [Bermanella marisrubri]|uniref:Recombination-associated protein RdgC n=1 Tax=Bermanella marisrubri TaxID=207949 RepID=Q1N0M2_9GAMM|nr:recombination-associated protein RdgC [Bermanella marisrubri]EAT11811.1 recombination associated protein [Oceanobacter sp. RED65] [Bermanella marisrubri]QIZ83845.1 recombination-associated protein RdgC [Bermanella marisrubri]
MQIRNFYWYALTKPLDDTASVAGKLSKAPFAPCMATQEMSQGWVAPAPNTDDLVYEAHGAILLMLKQEKRLLPASVINDFLAERVEAFEQAEGYAPSRKIKQQMKDEVVQDLLPRSFTKSLRLPVMIMPRQGWLFVLSSSSKTADDVTAFLRETLGSLPIALMNSEVSPAFTMTQWLQQPKTLPDNWTVGEEVELVDAEEASVRIKKQSLYSEEVTAHLDASKQVAKLALLWREDIQILLQDDLSIKRIKSIAEPDDMDMPEDPLARFAHEFAVTCQWLKPLCDDLLKALGGMDKALAASQSRNLV